MSARLRSVPDSPPRALALIRVSKERDGMISPELQDTAIGDYCAARGITITHRMEGLDESGSQSRSKWWATLDRAVGMVEDGQVDVIVVWKFSRTARHRLRWAVALDRVEEAGGRLESATEQVDVGTSTGRFTRGMLAELNAFEAERIGEVWKETHARRRSKGLHHTGGRRHGYVYRADKTWEPDPETAPLVVALYEQYVAGKGLAALAAWLRAVGLPPRVDGTRWTQRGVSSVLRSGFAAGFINVHDPQCQCRKPDRCPRRLWLRGAHEPIVGGRLWDWYLAERKRRAGTPARLLAPTTPLAGLVRCGACGYSMVSRGQGQPGYKCPNLSCTARSSVVLPRAEGEVRTWLREYAEDVGREAAVASSDRASRAAARSAVTRLARAVARLDAELVTLTREYTRGVVPEGAYVAARDELVAERGQAQAALDGASAKLGPARVTPREAADVVARWDELPTAQLNKVLRTLVRVVVERGEWRSQVRVIPAWEWEPPPGGPAGG